MDEGLIHSTIFFRASHSAWKQSGPDVVRLMVFRDETWSSSLPHPTVTLLNNNFATMDDMSKLQDEFDALNAKITKQGAEVRQLKKDGAAAEKIGEAVKALQALKLDAGTLSEKLKGDEPGFNRKAFDDLIIRKMFVVPSFEIHGGVKGLFDLGPPACGLKVRTS